MIIQNAVVSKGQPSFFLVMKTLWLGVESGVFNTMTESTSQTGSRAPWTGLQYPGNSTVFQQELRTGEWGLTADNSLSPATHFLSMQRGCYRPAHPLQPRKADTRKTRF